MYDFILKNVSYPNFQDNVMMNGNIAIAGGKIAKIESEFNGFSKEELENTKEVIDGTGLIASPGFIDIHMHEERFSEEDYDISLKMLKMGVTTCLGGNCGSARQRVRDFKAAVERLGGSPVYYLSLGGYNSERNKLGKGHYDSLNEDEIKFLIERMKEELQDGALGISFGIEYDPGISTEEIIEVINGIGVKGLFVSAHYREDAGNSVESVKEMIEIAEKTGAKFQISHLSSCSAFGQMEEALKIINEAVEKNPLINYDTYPYAAFSTKIGTEVFSEGCFERWDANVNDILLTDEPYKYQRATEESFKDARENHPEMYAVAFVMKENEIAMALSNPVGMIASDGVLSRGNGHPRASGTFTRVLGKYVREENRLSMIHALRKMSYEPAERLELRKKGRIELGADADITLFDPVTVNDGATFEDINIPSTGIKLVLINGKRAVENGIAVNERLGRFITQQELKNM